jgi:hypothetical protein
MGPPSRAMGRRVAYRAFWSVRDGRVGSALPVDPVLNVAHRGSGTRRPAYPRGIGLRFPEIFGTCVDNPRCAVVGLE